MKINFSLTEAAFLDFQLYMVSVSPEFKRRMLRLRLIIPILYAVFGLFFVLSTDSYIFGYTLIAVAVLWFIFYPGRLRRLYVRHYRKHILANFKNILGRHSTVEFFDDRIESDDSVNQGKIAIGEVEAVYEIPSVIIVKLQTGNAYVIPKDQIAALDDLRNYLRNLTQRLGVEYKEDLTWSWSAGRKSK